MCSSMRESVCVFRRKEIQSQTCIQHIQYLVIWWLYVHIYIHVHTYVVYGVNLTQVSVLCHG